MTSPRLLLAGLLFAAQRSRASRPPAATAVQVARVLERI